MKKIELKYFKAFKTQLIIEFSKQQKHLLLYGENGAGKSSIYEALKVVFFRAKLEKSIPVALTPEDQAQENSSFWSKYDNRNAHQKFEIKINGEYHTDFKVADYQVFMISPSEFFFDDSIKYDTLLRQVYFDIDIELELELENFCSDNYQAIQDAVNKSLKDFHETVEIVIDNEDDFTVKIVDRTRNIESKTEIKKYFNEAKLNLIMLLLLLTTIKRAEKQDKTQILVLDDFITSLDIANRTLLMKYVFDNFKEAQILLFTHNVNFYNLATYLINEIYKTSDKWAFGNLYEFDNDNKLFLKDAVKDVKTIKEKYRLNPEAKESIGNDIRQKFEILLYEFSKLLMIGAVEDSNKIMNVLENSKTFYFKVMNHKLKTATDLVEDLTYILNGSYQDKLKERLLSKIKEYELTELKNLQITLQQLKLYRKVTMHPLSHGTLGQSTFTQKEIEISLALLERFETHLQTLIDSNVAGI